ncbi:MAG: riboflavin synthase [Gammaproteobacteria bacterium]|nr:riboflavin synthase [Gammaproteobacteria bacterium]
MFTGIVQAVGRVAGVVGGEGGGMRMQVETAALGLAGGVVGESVAVNGVCLTIAAADERGFHADVSAQTLARTTFARVRRGARVNLERALTLATPLGGHLVSGHVDEVGEVLSCAESGGGRRMMLRASANLGRYLCERGSVCVDGVSLTVVAVAAAAGVAAGGTEFALQLVPHTLQSTTLGERGPGDRVNLEADLVARYLDKLLEAGIPAPRAAARRS